jgi:hypothetical protein
MKRTLSICAAAFVLLFALTGCMDSNNGSAMTRDQHYTADESGRTNEAGDNGVTTANNGTATNGRTNNGTNNGTVIGTASGRTTNGTTSDWDDRDNGTVRDSNAGGSVRRAVNRAGEVVDDVADGAADIVDDATDVVTDDDDTVRR